MTTVFEFQSQKIERMAASLAHFVATTAADTLDWRPSTDANSQTRSVPAQASECVQVNRYTAALLRGETPEFSSFQVTLCHGEGAQRHLIASGQELAAAVRDLDESALARLYPHWRGRSAKYRTLQRMVTQENDAPQSQLNSTFGVAGRFGFRQRASVVATVQQFHHQ